MSNKEIIEKVLPKRAGDGISKVYIEGWMKEALNLKEKELLEKEKEFLDMILNWDIDKEDCTTDKPLMQKLSEINKRLSELSPHSPSKQVAPVREAKEVANPDGDTNNTSNESKEESQ